MDLFSQPLVYVGNNNIIFAPALVLQINVSRLVEQQLALWNIEISQKGKHFEEIIRTLLSNNPHINVNTNNIEFDAYDGLRVEFDFLATFEDYLILMEMKCIKKTFSDKELKQRSDTINYGIKQLNRREKIIIKEWEKIKEYSSVTLPELPPTHKKVIKILCLNIFEFTGAEINGVFITDISSIGKFFTSPDIEGYSIINNKKDIFQINLVVFQAPLH